MTDTTISESAIDSAAMACEAIRSLNHATSRACDLTVSDLYRITADLAAMAHRLRQSCDQLSRILEHRLQLGGLRSDDGSDATVSIGEARADLRLAASHAVDVGICFDAAQQRIAFVGGYPE